MRKFKESILEIHNFVKIRYIHLESIFIVGTTSMTCFLTSVRRVDISFEQNCSTLTLDTKHNLSV